MSLTDLLAWLLHTPEAKVGLLLITIVSVLATVLLARWRWQPLGAFLFLWGTGMALTMTLGNRLTIRPLGFHPESLTECTTAIRAHSHPESLLNFLLLAPAAVGLVLLTRRLWPSLAFTIGFSVTVELSQNVTRLGGCEVDDLGRNIIGGCAVALLTWVFLRQHGSSAARRRGGPAAFPRQRLHPPSETSVGVPDAGQTRHDTDAHRTPRS